MVPSNFAMAYLQLPALDIRIPKLAQQLTASQDNSYDKAAVIERICGPVLATRCNFPAQYPGIRWLISCSSASKGIANTLPPQWRSCFARLMFHREL